MFCRITPVKLSTISKSKAAEGKTTEMLSQRYAGHFLRPEPLGFSLPAIRTT